MLFVVFFALIMAVASFVISTGFALIWRYKWHASINVDELYVMRQQQCREQALAGISLAIAVVLALFIASTWFMTMFTNIAIAAIVGTVVILVAAWVAYHAVVAYDGRYCDGYLEAMAQRRYYS